MLETEKYVLYNLGLNKFLVSINIMNFDFNPYKNKLVFIKNFSTQF